MDSITFASESVKYSPISAQSYSDSATKLATDDEGYAGDVADSGDESDNSFVEMRTNRTKKAQVLPAKARKLSATRSDVNQPAVRPTAPPAPFEDDELTMLGVTG